MSKAASTPRPWTLGKNDVGYIYASDCVVARCGDFTDKELVPFNAGRWKADAAFIVRAVNSHDALVAALPSPDKLDLLATWFEKYDADVGLHGSEVQDDLRAWAKNIRAALALAKSE
jgi:hypothetical protein